MDKWEKIKIIITALIPVVIALVGHWYSQALKEREVQARFVELGVSILQTPPSEESKNLRQWAIKVLDKYSGIPMGNETTQELVNKIPLPSIESWSAAKPDSAFCYQEDRLKEDSQKYSVHCHPTKQRCEAARGPNKRWKQSACELVDLREVTWNPLPGGWANSWYEFRSEPFPEPFPQIR
jgi:hypothetical protein